MVLLEQSVMPQNPSDVDNRLVTAKSDSPLTTGNLFKFTGSINIISLLGRVTTDIQAQATTVQISIISDSLSAYDITGGSGDINGVGAGSMIGITGTAANDITITDGVPAIAPAQANKVKATCVTSGYIKVTYGAASTGAITWELLWEPVGDGGKVIPA